MTLALSTLALVTALSGGHALLITMTAIADAIADSSPARALRGAAALLPRVAVAAVQCLCGFAFLAQLWI
jgi:hypothetical protein